MTLVGESDGLLRGLEEWYLVVARVAFFVMEREIVGDLRESDFEMRRFFSRRGLRNALWWCDAFERIILPQLFQRQHAADVWRCFISIGERRKAELLFNRC